MEPRAPNIVVRAVLPRTLVKSNSEFLVMPLELLTLTASPLSASRWEKMKTLTLIPMARLTASM
jgi:hypothetical protein